MLVAKRLMQLKMTNMIPLELTFQLADILGVTVDELFINKLPAQSIEIPTLVSAMGTIEFSNLIIIN